MTVSFYVYRLSEINKNLIKDGGIQKNIEPFMIDESTAELRKGFFRENLKFLPEGNIFTGCYGEEIEIEFLTLNGIENVISVDRIYFYLFLNNDILVVCSNKGKTCEFIAGELNKILKGRFLPQLLKPKSFDKIIEYCYELVSTTFSPARNIDNLTASTRGDLRNVDFYQEFSYEPLKKCAVRFPINGEIITIAFLSDGKITIYRGQEELKWIEAVITKIVMQHFKGELLQTTLKEDGVNDDDKHSGEKT